MFTFIKCILSLERKNMPQLDDLLTPTRIQHPGQIDAIV